MGWWTRDSEGDGVHGMSRAVPSEVTKAEGRLMGPSMAMLHGHVCSCTDTADLSTCRSSP